MLLGLFLAFTLTTFAYSDVPESYKYSDAINYVQEEGIVSGYEDGTFKPEQILNRAELLKIVIETYYNESDFDSFSSEKCFNDVSAGTWYTKYICFAKNEGFVSGYDGNVFKPGQSISFVEAVKIAMDVSGEYNFSSGDLVHYGDEWYQGSVCSAAASAYIPPDINSFDQYFSRGQMAEMAYRVLDLKENGFGYDRYVNWVTFDTIKYGDNVEESVYTPVSLSDVNELYQFALGSDVGDEPRNITGIVYNDWYQYFEVFYSTADDGEDLSWGTTNVDTYEDVVEFLNYQHPEDAEVIYDAWQARDSYFIFFRDDDKDAVWAYEIFDSEDDLLDFVNGTGEYDTPRCGPIVELDDGDIVLFYRSDLEEAGGFSIKSFSPEGNWVEDVYYFLNGFAGYEGGPLERVEFFGGVPHQGGDDYHVLYR